VKMAKSIDYEEILIGYNGKYHLQLESVKAMFLDAYERFGSYAMAADRIGISYNTYLFKMTAFGLRAHGKPKSIYLQKFCLIPTEHLERMTLAEICARIGCTRDTVRHLVVITGLKYAFRKKIFPSRR